MKALLDRYVAKLVGGGGWTNACGWRSGWSEDGAVLGNTCMSG